MFGRNCNTWWYSGIECTFTRELNLTFSYCISSPPFLTKTIFFAYSFNVLLNYTCYLNFIVIPNQLAVSRLIIFQLQLFEEVIVRVMRISSIRRLRNAVFYVNSSFTLYQQIIYNYNIVKLMWHSIIRDCRRSVRHWIRTVDLGDGGCSESTFNRLLKRYDDLVGSKKWKGRPRT